MKELIHYCTAPLLADPPGASRVADISTLQGNLMTREVMIIMVNHMISHTPLAHRGGWQGCQGLTHPYQPFATVRQHCHNLVMDIKVIT